MPGLGSVGLPKRSTATSTSFIRAAVPTVPSASDGGSSGRPRPRGRSTTRAQTAGPATARAMSVVGLALLALRASGRTPFGSGSARGRGFSVPFTSSGPTSVKSRAGSRSRRNGCAVVMPGPIGTPCGIEDRRRR